MVDVGWRAILLLYLYVLVLEVGSLFCTVVNLVLTLFSCVLYDGDGIGCGLPDLMVRSYHAVVGGFEPSLHCWCDDGFYWRVGGFRHT